MTTAHGGWWVEFLVEWHYTAAYLLAVVFPVWRWLQRKAGGHSMSLAIFVHQSATGFLVPAFVLLCFSYQKPSLLSHLSPHEIGVAGMFALVTSLRELFVNGADDEGGRWSQSGFR